MRMHTQRTTDSASRHGFTLLELMVVMAIILTLSALLLAAVFAALTMVKRLAQTTDIQGLNVSVAACKMRFGGLPYVPSKLTLARYPSGADQETIRFMRMMFPDPRFMATWEKAGMQWNDRGSGGTLYGHECLVFLLGGPQRGGRPIGWSTNPADPCSPVGPRFLLYEFNPAQLKYHNGSQWLAYYDADLQQPYAYFSSRETVNTYDPQDCQPLNVYAYGNADDGFQKPSSFRPRGKWEIRHARQRVDAANRRQRLPAARSRRRRSGELPRRGAGGE